MARKRLISPEFYQHGDLFDAELSSALPLRVAFSGLWTQSDRRGVFVWKPRELKLAILPYDHVDFSAVLDALEAAGFVRAFAVDNRKYGVIPNFDRWQTFHLNERPSHPAPPDLTQTAPHGGATSAPLAPYGDAGNEGAPCEHGVATVPGPTRHELGTIPARAPHHVSTPVTVTVTSTGSIASSSAELHPPPGGGGTHVRVAPEPPAAPPPPSGLVSSSVPEAQLPQRDPTAEQQGITDPVMLARQAAFHTALYDATASIPDAAARGAITRYLEESRAASTSWQSHIARFRGWPEGVGTPGCRAVSWGAIAEGLLELLDTNPTGQKITPHVIAIFADKAERRRTEPAPHTPATGSAYGRSAYGRPAESALPPELAALVASTGLSAGEITSAQLHASRGHHEWVAYCAEYGIPYPGSRSTSTESPTTTTTTTTHPEVVHA